LGRTIVVKNVSDELYFDLVRLRGELQCNNWAQLMQQLVFIANGRNKHGEKR